MTTSTQPSKTVHKVLIGINSQANKLSEQSMISQKSTTTDFPRKASQSQRRPKEYFESPTKKKPTQRLESVLFLWSYPHSS